MWYRQGTVSVTSGSTSVVGLSTFWSTQIASGDAFQGPDGAWYEILAVVSDTHLTLATPYAGTTASGQGYAVMRGDSSLSAETAQRLTELLDTLRTYSGGGDFFKDGSVAMTGDLDLAGHKLVSPLIGAASYTVGSYSLSGSVLTLDCATGNFFPVALTHSVGSIAFVNLPASGRLYQFMVEFAQDATGGRLVSGWPAGAKWNGGNQYLATSAAHSKDRVVGDTYDAGASFALGVGMVDIK